MPELRGATQDEVRRRNLANVLRYLHLHGASSRTDITAHMRLNRSTVGDLAGELISLGLARSAGERSGPGAGRPSLVIEPATEHIYVVAIEVAVDRLVVVRVGLGGTVLAREDLVLTAADHSAEVVTAALAKMVKRTLKDAGLAAKCVGIGVGVCGVVSQEDGGVRFAPNLGWVDVPLAAELRRRLGTNLPIVVGNDGNYGVLAEQVRGAAQGAHCAVYLTGGVGIGAGIVIDGSPLLGSGGFAGEVGHMIVNPSGRRCRCGSRGCWETEIGEEAILRATGTTAHAGVARVIQKAQRGDPKTVAGLAQVAHWLGTGTVNMVNLFNPDVVIFGAVLGQVYPLIAPAVAVELAAALLAPRQQVRLAVPSLGGDSSLLGAAEAAFAPLFEDPVATAA